MANGHVHAGVLHNGGEGSGILAQLLNSAEGIEGAVVGKTLAQGGDARGLAHQILNSWGRAVHGGSAQEHRAGKPISAGLTHGSELGIVAGRRVQEKIQVIVGSGLDVGFQRRVEQAGTRDGTGLLVHAHTGLGQRVQGSFRVGAQAVDDAVEHGLQLRVGAALGQHVQRAESSPQLLRGPVLGRERRLRALWRHNDGGAGWTSGGGEVGGRGELADIDKH